MQSRTYFSKGIRILLVVCFFGLTTVETSHAQRGGRSSSGPSSSTFQPRVTQQGTSQNPLGTQTSRPQPMENKAHAGETPAFPSIDRVTQQSPSSRSAFNAPRSFDVGRQFQAAPINRPELRTVSPSQPTYRAQQPSQQSIFGTFTRPQQPTVAPSENGRGIPSTTPQTVYRQSDGRSNSGKPVFAPSEPERGTERPQSAIWRSSEGRPDDSWGPSRDGAIGDRSDSRRPPQGISSRSDRPSGTWDARRDTSRESLRIDERYGRDDRFDSRRNDRDPRPPKHFPPSRVMVDDFRRGFNGYDRYWTNDWYRRHPGCWYPSFIPTVRWWYTPSWYDTWTWYGPGFFSGFVLGSAVSSCPYYPYYYGNNILYRGNMVYVNGVPYVSAAEYYSQALILAQSMETIVDDRLIAKPIRLAEGPILESPLRGGEKRQTVAKPVREADESADWLPMGTFALLDDVTQKESGKILQLATNKKGQLRGNYVDESSGETKQLRGAVDPKSQRVAFRLEGDDPTVLECGLWNLTQDSVPLLIHHGGDKTEQKTLIRLSKPEGVAKSPSGKTELAP